MRAGPLSNSRVIDELNQNFINTWILMGELKKMALDDNENEQERTLAQTMMKRFLYPVDSQIMAPGGELLGQLSTNRDLMRVRNPSEVYLDALKKGLAEFHGE